MNKKDRKDFWELMLILGVAAAIPWVCFVIAYLCYLISGGK